MQPMSPPTPIETAQATDGEGGFNPLMIYTRTLTDEFDYAPLTIPVPFSFISTHLKHDF
jgi:hypothetical protein